MRHTNVLVLADRGFSFWPMIEPVDVSVVDDLPAVLQLLAAIRLNFHIGRAWMTRELLKHNNAKTCAAFAKALGGIQVKHEAHVEFKKRVPHAIDLLRTGDTTQNANRVICAGEGHRASSPTGSAWLMRNTSQNRWAATP